MLIFWVLLRLNGKSRRPNGGRCVSTGSARAHNLSGWFSGSFGATAACRQSVNFLTTTAYQVPFSRFGLPVPRIRCHPGRKYGDFLCISTKTKRSLSFRPEWYLFPRVGLRMMMMMMMMFSHLLVHFPEISPAVTTQATKNVSMKEHTHKKKYVNRSTSTQKERYFNELRYTVYRVSGIGFLTVGLPTPS